MPTPRLRIEIGAVTVEFTPLTRREGKGKAGIRFWEVEAGASRKVANESTQTSPSNCIRWMNQGFRLAPLTGFEPVSPP